jgi:hypothetical protein
MNTVFQLDPSAITATERLVLLDLANHGNDRGRDAYPSVARIAAETSLTPRAIYDALGRLRRKGLIVKTGTTTGGVIRYALVLKRLRACERGAQNGRSRRRPGAQTTAAPDAQLPTGGPLHIVQPPLHQMHTYLCTWCRAPLHQMQTIRY